MRQTECADLVFCVPLLAIDLDGHRAAKRWHPVVLGAAMGITVYWPITALATVVAARGAEGWQLAHDEPYWMVLPILVIWSAWVLRELLRDQI